MNDMLFGAISNARWLIYNCTGYLGEQWHIDGVKLFDSIQESRNKADKAAKAAEKLLPTSTLDPAAGMTALRGAIAEVNAYAETAKNEAAEATKKQQELLKLLRQQNKTPTEVGDAGPLIAEAKAAETAAARVRDTLRGAQARSADWHALAARLNGGLLARINTLKEAPGVGSGDTLLQAHVVLVNQLKSVAGKPFDAVAVNKAVEQVTAGVGRLEQAIDKAEKKSGGGPDQLDKLRQAALLQFRRTIVGYGLDQVLDTAASKLRETMPQVQPRHLAGLVRNQTAAPARLATALDQATTPAAIDSALQEALRSYRDGVASLATDIHNGSRLPMTKERAQEGLQAEQDLQQFEAKKEEAAEALSALRLVGAPGYDTMQQRYEALVGETEKTRGFATAAKTLLPKLIEQIDKACNDHTASTEPEIERLKQQVQGLRNQFKQAQKAPNAKLATTLLETIRGSLDEADNFLDCSGNLEAAEPARGIITEVTELLRDFTANTSMFATLAKMLQQIETGLGSADLKLIPPENLAALTSQLQELKNPRNGLGPAEFKTGVETLKKDLDDQTVFGNELKQWRQTVTGELSTLTGTYNAFAQAVRKAPPSKFAGTRPDPTKGEIKAGLDVLGPLVTQVVASDAFATHKQAWIDTKKQVTDGLALVWDGRALKDGAAVSKDAEAGMKRAEAARQVTTAWEQLRDKAKGYETLVANAKGNVGELKLLMQQLAALPDQIARDPEVARAQLTDIEKRLETVRGTPNFDAAITRDIAKIPAEWEKVLDLANTNLTSLLNAISTAAAGSSFSGGLQELTNLVEETKRRFARDAFTKAAAALGQSDPTGAKRDQRRAAREEVLRVVRQYQDQLFKDPLFLHLQRNPFGVSLFGQLFRFLDRVELEFTRVAL
jgi:hypothetical protein